MEFHGLAPITGNYLQDQLLTRESRRLNLDIDGWLSGIGLAQYAELFRANDIDSEMLGRLTNDDLKDIGVASLGHRKKLLEAIPQLAGVVLVSAQPGLVELEPHNAAERRQVTVVF